MQIVRNVSFRLLQASSNNPGVNGSIAQDKPDSLRPKNVTGVRAFPRKLGPEEESRWLTVSRCPRLLVKLSRSASPGGTAEVVYGIEKNPKTERLLKPYVGRRMMPPTQIPCE